MEETAAAPPEHTDAALAAPDEPPAPAAPVLADAAPRRSSRAPKPKDRLDPGLEAKKPQWDTTSAERNRARAEARNAAEDTPDEEHLADADEDESVDGGASAVAESSDDEETLDMLRAKANRSVSVEPDVRGPRTETVAESSDDEETLEMLRAKAGRSVSVEPDVRAPSVEVEDNDDRSISSAAFGIESSATSLSEPVDDDSGGVGRGPPTESTPPCDQAQTEQRRALAEARNAFDQTRIALQSCPYKFTTVLLKTSTHLVSHAWTDFNAYVTSHGVRWSVRRRATGCSGGGHAVYCVDLSFDPHAVGETQAVGRLEAAPEALRVARARGSVAASVDAPSLLSGFPFQGSGGSALPVAAAAPSATQAPAAVASAPAPASARSSERRAAPRKRKNITTVLANVDKTNTTVAPFLSKLSTLVTSMPTEVGGWTDDGLSFQVNEELASRTVLPQYFSHTNFRSFVRQLSCYGFRKTRKKLAYASGQRAVGWSEFQHALFQRDRPELLCQIRRMEHLPPSDPDRPAPKRRHRGDRSTVVPPDPARAPCAPSSKFWGVTWNKNYQRWQASYTDASGKGRYIGVFDTQEEAARAVDAAIRRAGLEGQRHTNSVDANGPLVPKYAVAQP